MADFVFPQRSGFSPPHLPDIDICYKSPDSPLLIKLNITSQFSYFQAEMTKAYLIIDLQNDYFPNGAFPLKNIEATSAKAAEFLKFARSQKGGVKIIHIQHVSAESDPFFKPGTAGVEINEVVAPLSTETVIVKTEPNSFVGTDLQKILDAESIKELYIAGAMTNICVEGTSRQAAELGYTVTVLKDAVTTRDWEFDGKTVGYQDVNTAVFATLGFGYAQVLNTNEVIEKF